MPHSLVILENHFDAAAYQFLFDNAENLHALGYNQMLFELNDQHEPSIFMDTLRRNLPFMQKSPHTQSAEHVLKVYDKFCKLGFMCRFIDPESENIAVDYNERLNKAYYENNTQEFESVMVERTEATRQRDFIMANSILKANEFSSTKGGVIFVGGFLHNNLIKQLENQAHNIEHSFRYVIFHGKPLYDERLVIADKSEWLAVQDPTYRASFYGTDLVKHIKPSSYTFEMVKAILRLSSSKRCNDENPSIMSFFKEKLELDFEFSADEQSIVSASLKVRDVDEVYTLSKIKDVFPGLHFFSQRIPDTENIEISIPGTNLIDQRSSFQPRSANKL